MEKELNKKIEKTRILKPREMNINNEMISAGDDIIKLRADFKKLGKELTADSFGKRERKEIIQQAMEQQKKLEEIEKETEDDACEAIYSYLAERPGFPKDDIKEGADRVLKPFLAKIGNKLKKIMPREKLNKLAYSIRRKVMLLMAITVAFESGIAGATENNTKTEKQIDDAATAAVPESLINVDVDTTTLAIQDSLNKGVVTEEELEKFAPQTKYKYPEDGKYIDDWLKKLAEANKTGDKDNIEFISEFAEGEIETYNNNHPDDPQNTQQLIASTSREAGESMKERIETELPSTIHKIREEFRSEIRNHSLRCREGSRNIVFLLMAMEKAAKNKNWDKLNTLWESRADYFPPADSPTAVRDFGEYHRLLDPIGDLIESLSNFSK